MAIHGWGTPLWSSEIVAEFGDPNPGGVKWLSNFYRGGSYVPDTPNNANISTAGYIAHSMFYGAEKLIPSKLVVGFNANIDIGNLLTVVTYWKTGQIFAWWGGYSYAIPASGGTVYLPPNSAVYAGPTNHYFPITNIESYPYKFIHIFNGSPYYSLGGGSSGRIRIYVNDLYPSSANGWITNLTFEDVPSGHGSVGINISMIVSIGPIYDEYGNLISVVTN